MTKSKRVSAYLIGALAAIAIVAYLSITIYVTHYSNTTSPQSQYCWHEINSAQPFGVEKICEVQK